MTGDELESAGFRRWTPSSIDRYDMLYQKRVRDEHGTRYFINIKEWRWQDRVSYEVEMTYNDGCTFHPRAALRVTAWSTTDWTPADAERFAEEVWSRLTPNYYERYGDT